MATKGGPNPVLDSSLILNLDSINLDSYKEITTGNLWNYPASIMSSGLYGWNTWGQSTILNSGNALSVTYVSGHMGAYNYFEADMSISLVAGKTYIVSFDAKTVGGSNTAYGWLNDNYGLGTTAFTNIMTRYSIRFTCNAISWATYLAVWGLSAGNVVTMTNFSLVEVGTTWTDLSGNGNIGTMINGPTYDYSDSSIAFDGVDDYGSVAHNTSLNINNIITLSCWIKTSDANAALIDKRDSTADGYGLFLVNSGGGGKLHLRINSFAQTSSGIILSDNVWHYVCGTYDGTYIRLYVDGNLDNAPINVGLSTMSTTGSLILGCLFDLSYSIYTYSGKISNVQIFNRALSASEILQNYNALKSRKKFNATGGIITIVDGYKIHTFNSSDTFTTNMSGDVEVLVVAGGGSGHGGGGGGGGGVVRHNKFSVFGNTVVTIGAGGTGGGGNGINSTFSTLTAIGGGSGGEYGQNGYNGGSGGGGASYTTATGGLGVVGQGNSGGAVTSGVVGAGGGGAGTIGGNGGSHVGGNGGNGLLISISGYPVYYGGGGGGGAPASLNVGTGGLGGGGVGGYLVNSSGNGVPNTGGGAGGGYNGAGGTGGSGVVIVRYQVK